MAEDAAWANSRSGLPFPSKKGKRALLDSSQQSSGFDSQ